MTNSAVIPTLDLLVVAKPGVDAAVLVCEIYNETHDTLYGAPMDQMEVTAKVVPVWSGLACADPARVAWRLSIAFAPFDEERADQVIPFAREVAESILDLPRDGESGILAVVKLSDPAQLHGHTALYSEIYSLEMALREVASYIFAAEFPENLIDALTKSTVKTASNDNLPQESQLIKYGENRFFYILFDKYAVLNDSPDLKARHIAAALQGGTNLDEVREALDLRPIKEERHAGFLASLKTLMGPLEKVRNAVAHNRTVPESVRENFHSAAKRLREEIDSFWKREAAYVGNGDPPATEQASDSAPPTDDPPPA